MTAVTPNISLNKPDFDRRQWQDLINDNFVVIDALWAKYFATTGLVGVWQNATAYTVGQLVVDAVLGSIWRCELAHTSPSSGTFLASRTASPTYWSNYTIGVRYKGAWASSAIYAIGDFVATGFQFAVANAAHSSGGTFSSTDGSWEILIDGEPMLSTAAAYASAAGTYATVAGLAASAATSDAASAATSASAAAISAATATAGVIWCGTGSGADDVVLTCSLGALTDGVTVEWRQVSDNTTAMRLNPNGLGLVALIDSSGNAITAATCLASRLYRAKYSTTSSSWELVGPTSISVGRHVFPVHANAMVLNAASSPTIYSTQSVTNGAMINGLSFDSTAAVYAEFELPMPKSLATAGTITYRARWTATAGTSAQTCIWQLAAVGIGDGDPLDVAQGTAVDTTDLRLAGTTLIEHVGPESSAVTIASFASEDKVRFRVNRKITGNTLLTPAILEMVEVFLTVAKRTDA